MNDTIIRREEQSLQEQVELLKLENDLLRKSLAYAYKVNKRICTEENKKNSLENCKNKMGLSGPNRVGVIGKSNNTFGKYWSGI